MIRRMENFRIEQDKGFSISFDADGKFVTIKAWGTWDTTIAKRFEREFYHKIETMPLNEGEWHLLMDLSEFSNHSKEIEHTFSDLLLFAQQKGMSQKAIVAKHIVMPHLVYSLAHNPELKIDFFFQATSEAVQWLLRA